jgi:hypothetical protein
MGEQGQKRYIPDGAVPKNRRFWGQNGTLALFLQPILSFLGES